MAETRGKRTEGERAKAAIMLGEGLPREQILSELRIDRRTLWEWTKDPEFCRIRDEVIEQGVEDAARRLRSLAPLTVEAFRKGLLSDHKAVKGSADQIVDLPDVSLAVQTATKVSERIPEIGPRRQVDVDVDVAVRVADIIRELDGPDARTDARTPVPPPPGPPAVHADEPTDPNQAA